MTAPSPYTSGSVTTRMSTRRPSTVSAKRPSCGTRRSEMSRSARILMRETTPAAILRFTVAAGMSTPSTRNSTRVSPSSGFTWMSDAPCWIACATIEWTSLMIGASLSASSTSRLAPPSSPSSVSSSARSSIDSSMRARRWSSRFRSSTDAAAGRIAAAGHHADVVDRQDVGRVRHRQHERAVVGVSDGDRLIALGGLDADQVDRAHVEVVDGEVDEVEPEPLGDHTGELVVAQDAAFDEHEAGRAALRSSGCDGLLDRLGVGEAQVDHDLADHPRRAPRVLRRVQPGIAATARAGAGPASIAGPRHRSSSAIGGALSRSLLGFRVASLGAGRSRARRLGRPARCPGRRPLRPARRGARGPGSRPRAARQRLSMALSPITVCIGKRKAPLDRLSGG